jgi:hypothetical protein
MEILGIQYKRITAAVDDYDYADDVRSILRYRIDGGKNPFVVNFYRMNHANGTDRGMNERMNMKKSH